jgi:2-polyprenyl-3-methyl-5-hydroxy-6-metoxy-1,4-benzoquinol methylase
VPKIVTLAKNQVASIYRENTGMAFEGQPGRYITFCMWADGNDHNAVEYLLPQIQVETHIEPFQFEQRFASSNIDPPSATQLAAHEPWHYRIEFGQVATREWRLPMEWDFHRYRASLLVGLASDIAGEKRTELSVLDIACHCGVFALEFAERGFKPVRGLDLRNENISQARFLADMFAVPNTSFSVLNARNLDSVEPADIVFCGGLLYHVTFPMELFKSIFGLTKEFAIIDTVAQKHPFSGFHLVCDKDVSMSVEGEAVYEFMPTYRGIIDALHAVGFEEVYEVLGDRAGGVTLYQDHNVRSFVAVKNRAGVFNSFRARCLHVNE